MASTSTSRDSHQRMRLLSLAQQGVIGREDPRFQPPLTDQEWHWLDLAPNHPLARMMAGNEDWTV